MSVKLHLQSFVSSSSSNPWLSRKPTRSRFFNKRVVDLDHPLFSRWYLRNSCCQRFSILEDGNLSFSYRLVDFHKSRRTRCLLPFASADDGVTVNGSPQASSSSDLEEMRVKLDQSVQGEDYSTGLVQSLHDAARVFELAIKAHGSLSKSSWFSTAWLGVDKTVWMKALSYQASVYSLLQAAREISSRGDGRDRDINVFVEKSLSRQSAPLEIVIREKLSVKQPEVYEWFWSEQVPAMVTSFVNYFEKDQRFAAATAVCGKGMSMGSGTASDRSLLMLALSCIAAITKLGPTKVSCAQFFALIPDIAGRLMDVLIEFIPIRQAYHSVKAIGLRREFLVHFGPQAAACRIKNERGTEEVVFWVGLVQKLLQRAIDRERIWSRLATSETIEVLDRDLAIFGFFIALGRSTQSYLSSNGFEPIDEPIEGFIRYLIGGSVLYYPQLSSISSYQLYVEVVCEELDWLPFYLGNTDTSKRTHGHRGKNKDPPNAEAIPIALDVCSHWIQSFIKYSKWLESPSNVKAARFLSRGHKKLQECMDELGIQKNQIIDNRTSGSVGMTASGTYALSKKEPDSFDKALESVEEAMIRLEELLQELHVSSNSSGKEHLKAACSDLERIRKLKKEAEFLEVSFRAKAASLQQGDDDTRSMPSVSKQSANANVDRSSRVSSNPRGLWSFFIRAPSSQSDPGSPIADDDETFEQCNFSMGVADTESNEIQRFELLRNELIELEKRVQKGSDRSDSEEDEVMITDDAKYYNEAEGGIMVKVQKKDNIIEKSLDKFKETTTDVLQGTQLLAIDVSAALGLLRRVLIGDELTDKEKQALRRTMTDLASVVPIGFLMLLPVTAVGHAAMLAAIQRYVPSLIPSTYGPERLDLLRQLEKVKELEPTDVNLAENADE
ncbi:hypothetical protein LguiA_015911 [Lonicera macranthoides]